MKMFHWLAKGQSGVSHCGPFYVHKGEHTTSDVYREKLEIKAAVL